MIQYPLSFSANSQSDSGTSTPWTVSASGFEAACAIPKEFGGPGGASSPEDFFVLALSNCFVATFKVYASTSHLKFSSIQLRANLVVDKSAQNQPIAKSCELLVAVTGVEDQTKTLFLLKKVARSGILLNSVKTEIAFVYSINGEIAV